jgi:hypothetical protein
MKNWPESVLLGVVVLIAAGYLLFHNPLHFRRAVQVGGLAMEVPMLWTPVKNPDQGMLIALRREWAQSGTVDVMDRTVFGKRREPWTLLDARHEQAGLAALQAKDGRFSNPRFLDLNAGRFTAACEEAAIGGNEALTCYVVGTPLQFSYLGSRRYEPAARRMLGSLH